jgi:hypothetical protein
LKIARERGSHSDPLYDIKNQSNKTPGPQARAFLCFGMVFAMNSEVDDYTHILNVLRTGSWADLEDLAQLVDGFPNGIDDLVGRRWIINARSDRLDAIQGYRAEVS